MRMTDSMQTLRNHAAEALKAILHQVSAIKPQDIYIDLPDPDMKIDIQAHVDVYGHSHVLICKVEASGRPDHVRMALKELKDCAARYSGDATLVLIAPRVSAQAQAVCREYKTGFLDLAGNARLELGDAFIVKRTQPLAPRHSVSSISRPGGEQLFGAA